MIANYNNMKMNVKKIGDYKMFLNKVLGEGTYGNVYEGLHSLNKERVAIKVIDKKKSKYDQSMIRAINQEIKVLQEIDSTNVVKIHQALETNNNCYIIQELCQSDLQKYLRKNGCLSQQKAIDFLKQIVNGCMSLVNSGVVHRDIKLQNILLSHGVIKIADFGLSKKSKKSNMKLKSIVGSQQYMPLQLLKGLPYSSKVDVWAVGIVFYELLHGHLPWKASSNWMLIQQIQKHKLQLNNSLQPQIKSFLRQTLGIYENVRASWDEVFKHQIFKGCFGLPQQNKPIVNEERITVSRLRFELIQQNIDIMKVFKLMGLNKQSNVQLIIFQKFMKLICPNLNEDFVSAMFNKLRTKNSQTITIKAIDEYISIIFVSPPILTRIQSKELAMKVKTAFESLYQFYINKKIKLRQIITNFTKQKKQNMNIDQFTKMIQKLNAAITNDDSIIIFAEITTDKSNTIQYEELYDYYCKVNGLPQGFEDINDPSNIQQEDTPI